MSAQEPVGDPVIRVTGGASPAEVAAVVAVLSALRAVGDDGESTAGRSRRTLWNSRARAARPRLSPGPGAWRGSALPR